MKKLLFVLLFFACAFTSLSQQIVFDREHFSIVNQNGLARLSAELALHQHYERTLSSLSDIKVNISALVFTQQLIYNSLTQVDQGLKSALMVSQIADILAEIFQESQQLISFASAHPHLLIFAEEFSRQLSTRGINLVGEVSQRILAERSDLLLDAQKRDGLLRKIALELRIIRALVFSIRKSMFWASQRSIFSMANPFQNFINTDKRIASQILTSYKSLKK
ncbi:hypothetical protein QWY86_05755 [Pedobacter aquatilis]|uniref:hypothetical protein n=1 Tax=Pedobacter aquatilis TaxID=351343 RepID=UPI0025B285C3|nr:hypothetical protein [Pedobacter aquatilis]MDN3586161.1 hypothetical protein [Pedobacter aquatilis]